MSQGNKPARDDSSLKIADLRERLRKSALNGVACHMRDGNVILRGEVLTYYQKQLAQECIRQFNAPISIVNDITVADRSRHTEGVSSSGP